MSYKEHVEKHELADDFERAEQFARGRALMAPFLGLLVLTMQQGTFYAWDWGSESRV